MNGYLLIVDDYMPIRFLLKEALEEAGFATKMVASGEECLRCSFSEEQPSLILLDWQMPGLTGIEVLALLKADERTDHIPVIMITGEQGVEEQALHSGAYALLGKPVDLVHLLEIVHGALEMELPGVEGLS